MKVEVSFQDAEKLRDFIKTRRLCRYTVDYANLTLIFEDGQEFTLPEKRESLSLKEEESADEYLLSIKYAEG
jgi:hypothetical protein